jgi:ABC-2 type transport system ATP-binding protein
MPAIRTEELTKDYVVGFWRSRPVRALDRLSLEVDRGEVFGFLGPNGAGKSTTLKLLLQLVHPTSGRAEILGRPVGDAEVRRHLGFLPEQPYFYDHLTAEELISYFAGLFGYRGVDRRRRVERVLDEVGVGGERRLPLRKQSKGMLQRVGLAQALVNDPEVILLDEPMSGLDPIGRRAVRALILRLRDAGRTVFFSSHILSDAEALCGRVAILVRGQLRSCGRLADTLAVEGRGWEVAVAGLEPLMIQRLTAGGIRVTGIAEWRHLLQLPPERQPEAVLPELIAAGVQLISLTPTRESLEDLYVREATR